MEGLQQSFSLGHLCRHNSGSARASSRRASLHLLLRWSSKKSRDTTNQQQRARFHGRKASFNGTLIRTHEKLHALNTRVVSHVQRSTHAHVLKRRVFTAPHEWGSMLRLCCRTNGANALQRPSCMSITHLLAVCGVMRRRFLFVLDPKAVRDEVQRSSQLQVVLCPER